MSAPDLSHIAKAASYRYKNDPDDQGRRMAKKVTQMAMKLAELEERINELEGGRDRQSRSRIRNALHAMTRKAKGALKRIASSLADRERLPPQVRETSADSFNEEEVDIYSLDMSVLDFTPVPPQQF
ncbi:hypothetical protein CEP54_000307 [Fusarium duplospermum]|uniref:Uncharacterized protein n=1 Tax=Fusarium duplospermum TaxID=1325734 RepID=A0A428R6R3_9HYPO|nr:hypothetical protein CEP54_000307 [Fusarium duplospermum]